LFELLIDYATLELQVSGCSCVDAVDVETKRPTQRRVYA